MNKFFIIFSLIIIVSSCGTNNTKLNDISIRESIEILASDEFEGRAPGTEGGKLTKNYIAKFYKENSLTPLKNTYFLDVPAVNINLQDNHFFLYHSEIMIKS